MSLASCPRGCQSFKARQSDRALHDGVLNFIEKLSCGWHRRVELRIQLTENIKQRLHVGPHMCLFLRFAEKRGSPGEIASPVMSCHLKPEVESDA